MLSLLPQPAEPEDFFVERYRDVLRWALRLTGGDRSRAEDLVHDAFLRFSLNGRADLPDSSREAYLFVMVRNLHLSQVRRAARRAQAVLPLAEYDSLPVTLHAIGSDVALETWSELTRICQYACVRQGSSKAGSVLLLRFFLGFYPNEIAQLLRAPIRAVSDWLLVARREARAYVAGTLVLDATASGDAPPERAAAWDAAISAAGALSSDGASAHGLSGGAVLEAPHDRVAYFRRLIFSMRSGRCLTRMEMRELYDSGDALPVPCATLAHLVSCERCLACVVDCVTVARMPAMACPSRRDHRSGRPST